MRSNDRKLLFEDAGIVTMRPSDVPTYVEHGSADIGITGKDVLLEQAHRNVYELLDLGFGRCRMVVAAPEGGDPIGSALRRLGRVRIATKYPRIAERHFSETGRQAEIVEVKGSVELAPLTGLVDGIVDLTATGTTLAENGLRVVEEIEVCTARLIANPVAHKLKAEQIDRMVGRCGRDEGRSRASPAGGRPRRPEEQVAEILARRAPRAATRRCCDYTERFDKAELAPEQLRVDAREVEARGRRARAGRARRAADGDRQRAGRRRGAAARAGRGRPPARASAWRSPRCRSAARASTCPAAARRTRPPS